MSSHKPAITAEAIAHYKAGNLGAAAGAARTALSEDPQDFDALRILGAWAADKGQFAEAADWFQKACGANQAHAETHFNLAILQIRLGRTGEAIESLRSVIALRPDSAEAHYHLAIQLVTAKLPAEALEAINRASVLRPGVVDIDLCRADIHHALGNPDEALAVCNSVLERAPKNGKALTNKAVLLHMLGRFEAAVLAADAALDVDDKATAAWIAKGVALVALKQFDEGRRAFEGAVACDPNSAEALTNLGRLVQYHGAASDGLALIDRAIASHPGYALAHVNRGYVLFGMGRYDEAFTAFSTGYRLAPTEFAALNGMAEIHQHRMDWVAASRFHQQMAKLRPSSLSVLARRHFCDAQLCLWNPADTATLESLARRQDAQAADPFCFLNFFDDPGLNREISRRWADTLPAYPLARNHGTREKERPRIGYLSADFRRHATAYLISEVFELHDHGAFDIHLLSHGVDDGSAESARIRRSGCRFHDLHGMDLRAAAQMIADLDLDILVDLKGYTQESWTAVVKSRPARLHVNWLGYPGTLGADFADYIIADGFTIPHGAEDHYAEKIVRLPYCYQPNDRTRSIGEPRSRAEYGLPESAIVLCCFVEPVKIRPRVFDIWMDILRRFPSAVLWLLQKTPEAAAQLRTRAREQGVDPDRLVFGGKQPLPSHLARYRVADLALDSFPYGSHTTASDALWAGCPLVTLAGEGFPSRVAGSILTAAGLPDLVTTTEAAYRDLICQLLNDPAALTEVRRRTDACRHSALFDTPAFVRALEDAYRAMLARQDLGVAPDHFMAGDQHAGQPEVPERQEAG